MKKSFSILLLLFCVLLQIQPMAQVKKPKATPAIPQMPDIEKMLKNLPADQQAMVKQMMGNTTAKTPPIKKETPAPASPIIQIKLAHPVKTPTEAEAKDRLLWYKGKKINDSMLITTRAMVVLYSANRNMVIAQPLEEIDPFRQMVKSVSEEQKKTDEFIETEAAKPNSWMNYPIIQRAVDQKAVIDEQFNNAIKNTIALPGQANTRPATGKDKSPPPSRQNKNKPATGDSKNCAAVDNNTKSLLIKQHEALKALLSNPPDMSVDAPPKESFDMVSFCDKSLQVKYYQDVENWKAKALAYEWLLIKNAQTPELTLKSSGLDHGCADEISPGLSDDMEKSMRLGWSRVEEKIKQLRTSYSKDLFRQMPVMLLALESKRQMQLVTGKADTEEGLFADIAQVMEGPEFENYMNEQIEKKNWEIVLSTVKILERLFMCGHLEANGDEVGKRYAKLLGKVIAMNRFSMTVDIEFNERYRDAGGEEVLKINGSIKTVDKFYVCLYSTTDCARWYFSKTIIPSRQQPGDKSDASYIPMQVVGGLKSVKEDKKWVDYPYSGPNNMRMYFPWIQINYTRPDVPDSAVLQILRYEDDMPPMPVANAYTTDLTGYLNDVYMRPEITAGNEQKAMDFGKNIMGKFTSIISTQNTTTTLEKLKFQHSMMMQKQEAAKGFSDLIYTAYTVIPFKAQNSAATLIDGKVDTKHKNDNVEVVYGIFKLKVVNEPDPAIKSFQ